MLTHADRDEVKRRATEDFLNLYLEHGGTQRWKSLKCLFHEDGSPSAAIHKGRFKCFGCGISLDVFEFIQQIRGEDFKSALAFLAARYGVALQVALSSSDRSAYVARLDKANSEAEAVVDWKACMLYSLVDARDAYFHAYHSCLRYVLRRGLDHPFAADACELYEERYLTLDVHIERLRTATYAELLPLFRLRA